MWVNTNGKQYRSHLWNSHKFCMQLALFALFLWQMNVDKFAVCFTSMFQQWLDVDCKNQIITLNWRLSDEHFICKDSFSRLYNYDECLFSLSLFLFLAAFFEVKCNWTISKHRKPLLNTKLNAYLELTTTSACWICGMNCVTRGVKRRCSAVDKCNDVAFLW